MLQIPKREITLYKQNGSSLSSCTDSEIPKALSEVTGFDCFLPATFTNREAAWDTIIAVSSWVNRIAMGARLFWLTHISSQGTRKGCTPSSLPTPEACVPMLALEQYERDHFYSSGLFGSNFDIIQLGGKKWSHETYTLGRKGNKGMF